jgi:hypothetical protein
MHFINLAHRLFHPSALPFRKSTKVSYVHDEVQINLASVSNAPEATLDKTLIDLSAPWALFQCTESPSIQLMHLPNKNQSRPICI